MICYKDKTFCPYYLICKNGDNCDRALTQKIKENAKRLECQIARHDEFPECFIRWFE